MMEGAESLAILVTADSSQLFLIILLCGWLYHYFVKKMFKKKRLKNTSFTRKPDENQF